MSRQPIVGITPNTLDTDVPRYSLRLNIPDIITKLGAVPIIIPYSDPHKYFEFVDAFIIPGGNFDIHPSYYGETITSDKVYRFNEPRTKFEIEIIKTAIRKDRPILGICGGMQLINVALGGTLHQHIPDHFQHSIINHNYDVPETVTHMVKIIQDTKLHKIFEPVAEPGSNQLGMMTNSIHHQAIKGCGDGLVASAFTDDGVIEAIEHTKHRFCMGVQWHPEFLLHQNDLKLFEGLLDACTVN